jgi:serpin B
MPEERVMRRALNAIFLLFVAAAISACGGSGDSYQPDRPPANELISNKLRVTAPVVSSEDAADFANDNLAFAVDLHLALRSSQSGNFLFSPTSISTALAMLYAGAGTTTADQMSHALHFSLPAPRLHAVFNAVDLALATSPPNTSGTAFRLEVANSTWIQNGYPVVPRYLDTLAENYGAGIFTADFAAAPEPARVAINSWVADRTEDQIKTLFPQGTIDSTTRLVLANAVFFHGDWRVPFPKDSPIGTFHAPTGDVSIPTMHGHSNAAIWAGAGWRAGAIDYVGGTTSMIIIVPDGDTFSAFEAGLTVDSLNAILAGARSNGTADVFMPRFKFSTDLNLIEPLSLLGMPEAFTDRADFSGINGVGGLRVQSVVHKAIIVVDEKGTTASAATGAGAGIISLPPTLFVDRPFLFFIRHNATGAILFQGRVVDPSK